MRVAIDARNLIVRPSGIGRYIVETTRQLNRLGCSVTLYLPEPPDVSFSGISGVRLRIADARGPLARALWGQTMLPKQVAKDEADVFWGPAHRLPGRLPGPIPKVLTVLDLVWIHAPATMRRRTWAGERLFMGPAVRGADAIVTISHATAADVISRYKLPPDRVVTIYPGVTELPVRADDTILKRNGLCDGRYALFVGTLEPRKNLARLISAYALLPPEMRARCRLVVAGGRGWRLNDLSEMIARHGLKRDVVLVGYASEPDLGRLYAGARFVAMPSLYEGFGLPIVEANAFGVPTLTSDRPSMSEVAGAAGHLVDPYDIASITKGFCDLVEDVDLHSRLAAAAKANAARFDWACSAEKLMSVFDTVVRRGAALLPESS